MLLGEDHRNAPEIGIPKRHFGHLDLLGQDDDGKSSKQILPSHGFFMVISHGRIRKTITLKHKDIFLENERNRTLKIP